MENSIQNRGGAVDEQVGQISGPILLPEDKVSAIATYTNGGWSGTVIGRYIGDGELDRLLTESSVAIPGVTTIDNNHVGSVFYTDLTMSFEPTSLDGLRVFGTIQNLFDRAPPLTPQAILRTGPAEVSPAIHDQIGRRFTLGVSYDF